MVPSLCPNTFRISASAIAGSRVSMSFSFKRLVTDYIHGESRRRSARLTHGRSSSCRSWVCFLGWSGVAIVVLRPARQGVTSWGDSITRKPRMVTPRALSPTVVVRAERSPGPDRLTACRRPHHCIVDGDGLAVITARGIGARQPKRPSVPGSSQPVL
jgi:hypothetical protein